MDEVNDRADAEWIDAEWSDICYAIDPGPATWQDWIEMGRPES